MLSAPKWEIEAALLVSEIAYDGGASTTTANRALHQLESRFSILGGPNGVCTLCSAKGQKYVVVIVQRSGGGGRATSSISVAGDDGTLAMPTTSHHSSIGNKTLFCAFAGTHLPGDWERTNIHLFHETNAAEVGAPGHAGYLKRSEEIPLEGIERLARDASVSRIVFCGHSLGGAVAHFSCVRWLFGLQSPDYHKENVVSIAFGAPFFGGRHMIDHIKRHGWLHCFITFVNGDDPVPRIMNLAATLVEATITCAFAALLTSSVNFLSKPNLKLAVGEAAKLAQELSKRASSASGRQEMEYLLFYLPIGQYVLFPAEPGVAIEVSDDPSYIADLLGPTQLLAETPSFIAGFLNQTALAHHDLKAYQNIIHANETAMQGLCIHEHGPLLHNQLQFQLRLPWTNSGDDHHLILPAPSQLKPVVYEISCETFYRERQYLRIIKIIGSNLDFVGNQAVTFESGMDPEWTNDMVKETRVSRRTTTNLELEQTLHPPPDHENDGNISGGIQETTKNKKNDRSSPSPHLRWQPTHDVDISLRSDLVLNGGGAVVTESKLARSNCHSAFEHQDQRPQDDPLSFYGGQFFLDTQQQAWITKTLFHDSTLEKILHEFAQRVEEFQCVKFDSFPSENRRQKGEHENEETNNFLALPLVGGWKSLEDVGQRLSGAREQQLREELYRWVVPPNGLSLRTKAHKVASIGIIIGSLVVGGGIIWMGGLGLIGGLINSGGSLTGGYGTAALLASSGTSASFLMFRSRLRNEYTVLLEDLIQIYTGRIIPRTMKEMELEALLLRAESEFQTKLANGCLERTQIPLFDEYSKADQRRIQQRVQIICWIHTMKIERMKGKLVAICGPRDSGKTTLVSQLLQRPELALGTGIQGGEGETRSVIPYSLPGVPSYALLDTPGLTSPEESIRDKFERAALNLASTFVYVREYQGLPTEVDLKTITKILENAARVQNPQILICLNRCRTKLTEDAAGEIWHLKAVEEKKAWLTHLYRLRSIVKMPSWVSHMMISRCSITVEFIELKGDRQLEAEFGMDERTRGIWTTYSIAEWIVQAVKPATDRPKGHWEALATSLRSFRYKAWQEGVREGRNRKIALESEKRRLMMEAASA